MAEIYGDTNGSLADNAVAAAQVLFGPAQESNHLRRRQ